MPTVTLEEAQAKLPELIEKLIPGDPLVITRDQMPIAQISTANSTKRRPRVAGSAKGILTILQDDDTHLEDFKEYME